MQAKPLQSNSAMIVSQNSVEICGPFCGPSCVYLGPLAALRATGENPESRAVKGHQLRSVIENGCPGDSRRLHHFSWRRCAIVGEMPCIARFAVFSSILNKENVRAPFVAVKIFLGTEITRLSLGFMGERQARSEIFGLYRSAINLVWMWTNNVVSVRQSDGHSIYPVVVPTASTPLAG